MSDKEESKKTEEDVKEMSQADNLVVGLATYYMKPFCIALHCEPDVDSGVVKVTLKDSFEERVD